MIRINLLPGEERRQRKAAVALKAGDLVVPLALLVATALIVAGTALSQRTRADGLVRSIADVDAQSRVLAPQIERVNRLAQERAELDLRLGIIGRLQKGRTQSVRLMDELARCIPEHLWVSAVNQEGRDDADGRRHHPLESRGLGPHVEARALPALRERGARRGRARGHRRP